jgi:hypothetical protein
MKTLVLPCIQVCLLAFAASVFVLALSADAATPLQVAPQAYLKASNAGHSHNFGYSTAMAGDTMVVGAPGEGDDESGAAYVFVRHGTNWSQQARL